MKSGPLFEAITAVVAVEAQVASVEDFRMLGAFLEEVAIDHEIVIVANGSPPEATRAIQAIVEAIPNVTAHFLAQRGDRDSAVLIGIDRALGDWIVCLTPTAAEIAKLPEILTQMGSYEVVFAGARERREIPALYRKIAPVYFRLYELMSGSAIDWPAPRIRVYSRAAARYLVNLMDGEFALRSLHISGAFPGLRVPITGLPSNDLALPRPFLAFRKAVRGLLNASAVPLRAVIGTALLTGLTAIVSSAYATLVYIFKADVAPGWVTLSLQISMMMFFLSVMFALLAEYVLNVYRALGPRRRIAVIREIRSPLRSRANRLNVVGSDGSFKLGAPADVPAAIPSRRLA